MYPFLLQNKKKPVLKRAIHNINITLSICYEILIIIKPSKQFHSLSAISNRFISIYNVITVLGFLSLFLDFSPQSSRTFHHRSLWQKSQRSRIVEISLSSASLRTPTVGWGLWAFRKRKKHWDIIRELDIYNLFNVFWQTEDSLNKAKGTHCFIQYWAEKLKPQKIKVKCTIWKMIISTLTRSTNFITGALLF